MREYSPLYSATAAEFILNLSKRTQRKLVDACNRLADHAFTRSDYHVRDADGRDIEHIRISEFMIA